ncbi:tetratricopeptide repeat protein [Sorangium sp. So ce375]|uniref:tetratricopeptide repeat protein n=1 Tax=Sorangium sp. So ce375 TaxID=3133306 RepID=UPI003F5C7990
MTTDCRSELLTRVRRGVATEPDRLAFDAHLGSCASCRISWVLAQDFDAAGAAEPGDAALLARIASAAIGGTVIDLQREGASVRGREALARGQEAPMRGQEAPARGQEASVRGQEVLARGQEAPVRGAPVRGDGASVWLASAPVRPDNDVRCGDDDARPGTVVARRRWAGWTRSTRICAAAAVLVAGAAAAATALVQPHPAAEVGPRAHLLEPSLRAAVSRSGARALPGGAPSEGGGALPGGAPSEGGGAPAPTEASARELASAAPKPREAQRGPSAPASSPAVSTAAPSLAASTAEQLFREANDARRAGSSRRAIELYRALQKGFATSPEATLSLVSLGGLLLNAGSAAGALAQFDLYLGTAGARPLAVEALYGRGRALRALGRTGDEAQTWRRLLREHPGSPYVDHARRRLAELGG